MFCYFKFFCNSIYDARNLVVQTLRGNRLPLNRLPITAQKSLQWMVITQEVMYYSAFWLCEERRNRSNDYSFYLFTVFLLSKRLIWMTITGKKSRSNKVTSLHTTSKQTAFTRMKQEFFLKKIYHHTLMLIFL